MSEGAHLAERFTGLFNSDRLQAFTTFSVATRGLTAAEAASAPAERFNSVWAIVNHIWFWNEAPLRKLRGEPVAPQDLGARDWGGWVPIGDPSDEAAWDSARQRAIDSNAALAAALAELDSAGMEREIPGWGPVHSVMLGMFAHNSYHTCEIITVRHMQGLWLERT